MTDEEIKNKAKETSGGNYYYEQGFIYGFELGEENGRKELEKEIAELKAQIEQLSNDNHVLKTAFIEQQEQIEKLKCCGNCGNDKCTSKYRGNSIYHRQKDGYACADNEDWIPRKMEIADND